MAGTRHSFHAISTAGSSTAATLLENKLGMHAQPNVVLELYAGSTGMYCEDADAMQHTG